MGHDDPLPLGIVVRPDVSTTPQATQAAWRIPTVLAQSISVGGRTDDGPKPPRGADLAGRPATAAAPVDVDFRSRGLRAVTVS